MHTSLATWLRGIGVRQVRLITGLVMFVYIFSHFFNHALGNISYDAMETWLRYHVWFWRIPIVNDTLYLAAIIHFSLGLWALYQRRHFRYSTAEITQLVLGLSIPLWLAGHLGAERLSGALFGWPPFNYASALYTYWVTAPYNIAVQFISLTVAWTHACIGLYFWLRLKSFFDWAAPVLLSVAVLMPALAMIGAHHGGREVAQLAEDSEWRNENLKRVPAGQARLITEISLVYFPVAYGAAIGLVFAGRGLRTFRERRRGMVTISYPNRQVRVPKGMSVLEASLRHKIPHASVCGGRARCSTCRIRVVSDRSKLPQPTGREAFVLESIGVSANPSIRLACQLRPQSDLSVIPILPASMNAELLRKGSRMNIGKERYIVSMFVDMRGSTKLAEARLPFDVVFLINRFLGACSQAALDAGGQPNQFVGDGVLALFGIEVDAKTACRQAIRAATKVATNVDLMNRQLASDLPEPIQYGIGIHGGEVIIGDIGFQDHTVFTALGDPVNVAARLQDMTKTLDCKAIISDEVFATAGVAAGSLASKEVTIRGREEPMIVRTIVDPTVLARLVDEESTMVGGGVMSAT
ncbi:MAG: adenylate/guanylate cyclase domain-containing protein [Pseudolabrys sp.]|nr:adenylate/guanylate cyclase domain-containing protein [Pseudolabrys sp.]